jgi:hypothetical protein
MVARSMSSEEEEEDILERFVPARCMSIFFLRFALFALLWVKVQRLDGFGIDDRREWVSM